MNETINTVAEATTEVVATQATKTGISKIAKMGIIGAAVAAVAGATTFFVLKKKNKKEDKKVDDEDIIDGEYYDVTESDEQ